MTDRWMSIVAAADTLGVSTRTVERRLAAGRLQARRTDDGQRQVLVAVAEDDGQVSDTAAAVSAVSAQADRQVQLALGSAHALAQAGERHADLALADAARARTSARVAWSAVAVMAAAVMVAVGWTTRTITRAQATTDNLVRQVSDLAGERDKLRADLHQAHMAAARLEGMAQAQVQPAVQLRQLNPTTRPWSLADLASLFMPEDR